MNNDIKSRVTNLFNSLKKGETFSFEIREQIKKELERVTKEAIEYNKKKREGKNN